MLLIDELRAACPPVPPRRTRGRWAEAHPEVAEAVRQLLADGLTPGQVAVALTAQGIAPPNKGAWNANRVRRVAGTRE